MKNNKSFLIIAVVAAVVIFAGFAIWNSNQESVAPKLPAVDASLLIKPHSFVKGNPDAKVTLTEFLDPECEACSAMHPVVKSIMSEYDGKIKLVLRYMPLHGNSKMAAVMLEEAREQGKFNEALDAIFDRHPEWADHGQPRPELLPQILANAGVDRSKLKIDELMTKYGWRVDLDHADGISAGVRFTPTFFVNGVMLNGIGYGVIKQAIEDELAR